MNTHTSAQDIIRNAAEMWNGGLSMSVIAERLGKTRSTIAAMKSRHITLFKPNGERSVRYEKSGDDVTEFSQVSWTPDKLEMASSMWNGGKTAGQISIRMRISLGAVKAIMLRRRDLFPKRGPQKASASKNVAGMKPQPIAAEKQSATKITPSEFDRSRLPYAKALVDLEPCECRWALTDDGPHMFCAEVTVPGASWCDHHAGRVAGKGTISERGAIRDARRLARRGL